MSSSIPRARPPQRSNTTVPSSIPTRSSSTREPSASRNASPTRLPSFKYGARAASIASSSSSSTNSLKNTTTTTTTSSGIPKAPTATGIPGRLTRSMTLATKEVIARKERTASANKYPPSTTMTRPSLQTRGRSTSISMPGKPKELERRPTGIAYARTSATNLAGPVVSKPPNPSRSRDPIRRPATPTAPVGAPGTARRSATPTALTRSNTFSASGRPVTPTAASKARTPPSSSGRVRTPPMGLTRAATFSASTRSTTSATSAPRSGPRSIGRSVTPTSTAARGGNSAASSRAVTPTGPPRTLERKAPSVEKLPARKPSLATISRVVSRLSKPSSAGTLLSQDQASLKPRTSTSSLQRPGSPAKSLAPKLSTSHLAPPSPSKLPSNIAASAEVSKLQAELLQLYLLHREAPVVEAEWRASAKQKLGDRFAKLSEESRDVSEQESAAQEKKNVLALRRWGSGGRLDEKIQSLESIITNVWSLSDPSGRYANLVRHFEKWIGGVSDMEEARRNGAMLAQGNNDLFIEDLDAQWKEERQELINQLDGWKQQLSDIDDLTLDEFYAEPPDEDEKSSLEKMLDGSRALINNMLAELRIMEVVEHEALLREDEWIGRMNRIGADDDFEIPRAGGAWKEI
ncbi:uncharacterized protein TrAFT101_001749 [Trichoderma asperellum]|uniref:uncharacterized protein n=1 Tax=Trichoderma asperellum TaxID=101201 RepID=UPI00332CE87B|nr:hypothetical protein TrAFT101_001749 [Trichoderma asperellum]